MTETGQGGVGSETRTTYAANARVLPITKRPLTWGALRRIEEHVELMRWSGHETDDEVAVGSLADLFWNGDVPRLIAAVKRALADGYPV